MARGGFFEGNHWVPYKSGTLSRSTSTSVQEFRKQATIKCPKCGNIVPLKDFCIACDFNLKERQMDTTEIIQKKHCPICNKAQDINNSTCIKCNYEFNTKHIINVKETTNKKPKTPLFNSEFSDAELFDIIKNGFKNEDYIKWDKEYIPKDYNFKLKRFFNNSDNICFSRLKINDKESIYYFADKKERFPKLMLFFNYNTIKSNFKVYNKELLLLLKVNNNLKEIIDNFKVIYASKNKKSKLFYISLGKLEEDDIVDNIRFLINEFGGSISNPLTNNYEYYEKLKLEDLLK